jgi:tight adherence protein B
MSQLAVTMVMGGIVFLGVYFSFSYWSEKIGGSLKKTTTDSLQLYQDMFYQNMSEERVRKQQSYVGAALAALFFFLFWPYLSLSIPISALMFWVGWNVPRFLLKYVVRSQRVKAFSLQMVDGLTLMANGLKAGLNIPQTLQIVVDEMPKPISEEFGFVLKENQLGVSLEQAFTNLAKRIQSEDVSMFVTSVNILSETGGNIGETFQNITKTIRERLKLQSKIVAMTAQGMMSAIIVGALPWGLGGMLYAADPETMRPLFTTIPGFAILLLILILEAMGFFVIMKIVKIRV